MICFNSEWLRSIGMSAEDIHGMRVAGDFGGVAISNLHSFGGGGNRGRDSAALALEPEPRSLILVGMEDRYDEGQKRAPGRVITLCVTGDGLPRSPDDAERQAIVTALEQCSRAEAATIKMILTQPA